MSPLLRTGKTWTDPDSLIVDWHTSDDGARLTLMLDYAETVAARKDQSIAMGSQWRVHGDVYQTRIASVLPAQGVMRVEAERCGNE